MEDTFIDNIYDKFTKLTKKPEKLLSAPEKLITNIRDLIKETYDFTKKEESNLSSNSDTLPSLIVEDFDVEQIWQQIELQNNYILNNYLKSVSNLVAGKDNLWFFNDNFEENISEEDIKSGTEDNLESENDKNEENNATDQDEEIQSDNNIEENEISNKEEIKSTKKKYVVDDEFFKLDEMEKFLQNEEKQPKNKNVDSSDDEESVDLFDIKPDTNLDTDSEKEEENGIKYDDFFGKKDVEKTYKKRKQDSDDELNENESDFEENVKSSLELREERLKKRIEFIEENAVKDKSWQLKGEVTADKRPQNSLLEEFVEFDMSVRPAPVITEETTYNLEDMIRKRIKDKVWDDVERKAKLVDTPLEYKKKLILDQEKSKQSLAQIYEDEYLKQKEAMDPNSADKPEEEPKEHIEIRSMIKSLFTKLDALSNFHFTPKLAVPELRIVNNLPAINMEEVAPVAVSDATLLAPEEIKKKPKGDLIGRDERTDTDKKRERRKKKLKQRVHANEKMKKEKLIEKMKPGLGNKYSKQKVAQLLDKVTKDKNVDRMDESGSKIKSSTAFFSQLQEEVEGHIKSKLIKNKKAPKQVHIAKKLKL